MIKVSDYVAKTLADHGVRHVFLMTGGGAMHLNDAFGKEKRIRYICNHHEQACAMAAEGYARVSGNIGVVNVTTGPGGINALNGVFGAWTDSIPMLVISGQVNRKTSMASYNLPGVRQLGYQEADVIQMVKGITKYAVLVNNPRDIRYHLEKALYLAVSGRPGPCWLDIPLDVQAGLVEEQALPGYSEDEDQTSWNMDLISQQCRDVIQRIQKSVRPVLLAGSGIRSAKAQEILHRVMRKLCIPVTTTFSAIDLVATDDPLFCGRPGSVGDRAGNFTIQNADTLLIIGSSLNLRQISHNWESFAEQAYKIRVDIDAAEFSKPTVKEELAIRCDARIFLEEMDRQLCEMAYNKNQHSDWVTWCLERVRRYPVVLPKHRLKQERINPYHFIDVLIRELESDDVVVCGNGSAFIMTFQMAKIKRGQRVFTNSGNASMGYDLPAAIGAAVARENKRVICITGEGSIQLNIQELQTIFHHQFPIKIFVINNNGYLFIRQSQKRHFGNFIGEGPDSGVSFPDLVRLAQTYGIPSWKINQHDFVPLIAQALMEPGPVLCEVMVNPDQTIEPKLVSKLLPDGRMYTPPLEDMYPFLGREELESNLVSKPLRSSDQLENRFGE